MKNSFKYFLNINKNLLFNKYRSDVIFNYKFFIELKFLRLGIVPCSIYNLKFIKNYEYGDIVQCANLYLSPQYKLWAFVVANSCKYIYLGLECI